MKRILVTLAFAFLLAGRVWAQDLPIVIPAGTPGPTAFGRSISQSAQVASVVTYTPSSAASFLVSAQVLIRTATTHNFTVTVAYTDFEGTGRTTTFAFLKSGDTSAALTPTIVNTNGTIAYQGVPVHIDSQAGSAITIATTGTFTTVSYDVAGWIQKISS